MTLPCAASHPHAGVASARALVDADNRTFIQRALLLLAMLAGLLFAATDAQAQPAENDSSQLVTWSCTGSPCPWGGSLSGHALVWPEGLGAASTRLGYTTSAGVYLPDNAALGLSITITSGGAAVFAGLPGGDSHRSLASLGAGQTYAVAGIAPGEVVSVQSGASFTYTITPPAEPAYPSPTLDVTSTATDTPAPTATDTPVPTATDTPAPTATDTPAPTATDTPVPTATDTPAGDGSQLVTWTCTGSPCPWGGSLSGHALVWPEGLGATAARLGYTTSAAIYLPAEAATGLSITITSGGAAVFAGLPGGDTHRALASIAAGGSYTVAGIAPGEVVSVQADAGFTYTLAAPPPASTPTPAPSSTATPEPTATSVTPDGVSSAQLVTWMCSGSPCEWGNTLSGHAVVWPSELGATAVRLGYTTSAAIYLPAEAATGMAISMVTGSAGVYAGPPDAPSHRILASLGAGETYTMAGLVAGEVVSVQGGSDFTYTLETPETPPGPQLSPTPAEPTATPGPPTATPVSCVDPQGCDPVTSILAYWRCNIPGCTESDWAGAVINWPAWSAYAHNDRTGSSSRTVYSSEGVRLYPYMGGWADGCQVTAVSGIVLIIEWERGTDAWRGTILLPEQTHTISLMAPEDGAMIEGLDDSPGFSVSLANCTPQLVEPESPPEDNASPN